MVKSSVLLCTRDDASWLAGTVQVMRVTLLKPAYLADSFRLTRKVCYDRHDAGGEAYCTETF